MSEFNVVSNETVLFSGKNNVWIPFLGYREIGFTRYTITGGRIYVSHLTGWFASEQIERKIRLVSEQTTVYTGWQSIRNWFISRANDIRYKAAIAGRDDLSQRERDEIKSKIEFEGKPLIGTLVITLKDGDNWEKIFLRNIEFPERLRYIIRLQAEFKKIEEREKMATHTVTHHILHSDEGPVKRWSQNVFKPPEFGLPPPRELPVEEVYEDITNEPDACNHGWEFFDRYYSGRRFDGDPWE